MTEKLQVLIHDYERSGDFTHAKISNEVIQQAEKHLHVLLPKQYVDFLICYGHGGIGGIEIIGIGKTGKLLFVEETKKYRKYGLPENYLVTENCDEWLYCIDCNTGKIVSWSNSNIEYCYPDFDTYLKTVFTMQSKTYDRQVRKCRTFPLFFTGNPFPPML